MTFKTALIFATTAVIALGSFEMRPAAAAPEGGRATANQNAADDFSAQRKRRRGRGVNPAIPLAAFGALIGTIGAVAAAQRQRDAYERQYYYAEQPYYYGAAPQYVAPPSYYYAQPRPYVRQHRYVAPPPAYRQRGVHVPRQGGHVPRQHGYAPPPPPSGPAQLNSNSGDGRL